MERMARQVKPHIQCGTAIAANLPGRPLLSRQRRTTAIISQAFVPPSTVRLAPVMYDASGPATNATIAAISSTDP
jgi:hypothetical protein